MRLGYRLRRPRKAATRTQPPGGHMVDNHDSRIISERLRRTALSEPWAYLSHTPLINSALFASGMNRQKTGRKGLCLLGRPFVGTAITGTTGRSAGRLKLSKTLTHVKHVLQVCKWSRLLRLVGARFISRHYQRSPERHRAKFCRNIANASRGYLRSVALSSLGLQPKLRRRRRLIVPAYQLYEQSGLEGWFASCARGACVLASVFLRQQGPHVRQRRLRLPALRSAALEPNPRGCTRDAPPRGRISQTEPSPHLGQTRLRFVPRHRPSWSLTRDNACTARVPWSPRVVDRAVIRRLTAKRSATFCCARQAALGISYTRQTKHGAYAVEATSPALGIGPARKRAFVQ